MAEFPEPSLDEAMEQIRRTVRRQRQGPTGSGTPPPADDLPRPELVGLESLQDSGPPRLASHRKLMGPLVLGLKRTLMRLLTPVLDRQAAYNATNTRVVSHLAARLATLDQGQDDLRAALTAVRTRQIEREATDEQAFRDVRRAVTEARNSLGGALAEAERRLAEGVRALHDELDGLRRAHGQDLARIHERLTSAERKLRRVLYAAGESGLARPAGAPLVATPVPGPDFDYPGFEEQVRGSEEGLRARQGCYVDYFRGQEGILEIGCGRGVFLGLLREAGISATGVDRDPDMVLHCRQKGLAVVNADALAHLQTLPDGTLGGVFAAQVIEHLEASEVVRLVGLCHEKLRPGGVLVLETLNPESLLVHYRWFWMDPTHRRLVHPETLKYLYRSLGFADVACRFLPVPPGPIEIPLLELPGVDLTGFNAATAYLNRLLYASTDYAVIGRR